MDALQRNTELLLHIKPGMVITTGTHHIQKSHCIECIWPK